MDADFAGNYDYKDTQSRDTARSRHGYIIMYKGYPVSWKLKFKLKSAYPQRNIHMPITFIKRGYTPYEITTGNKTTQFPSKQSGT